MKDLLLIGFVTSAKMQFQSYRKILFHSIEAAVVRQAVLRFRAGGAKHSHPQGLALTGFSGNATMPGPNGKKADCS